MLAEKRISDDGHKNNIDKQGGGTAEFTSEEIAVFYEKTIPRPICLGYCSLRGTLVYDVKHAC